MTYFHSPYKVNFNKFSTEYFNDIQDACLTKIAQVVSSRNISFTPSCTDALELSSLLLEISNGDEIIAPSFTLSATLNPFVLRGATIKFVDSLKDSPNIDVHSIEKLITQKTKAIVLVHYAGISCDMEKIMQLARAHNIYVIEDAAHCINAFYKNQHLGTIGDIGTISFHESKNIHCFEGGAIIVKDDVLFERVDVLSNMGTNKTDFLLGKTYRYDWVDIGSSYKLSSLNLVYLHQQLLNLDNITSKRLNLFKAYYNLFSPYTNYFSLPFVPEYSKPNGHIFFIKLKTKEVRDDLMNFLNNNRVQAVKHYEALHTTKFGKSIFSQKHNPVNALEWSNTILRLPLHYYLSEEDICKVSSLIIDYFKKKRS